MSFLSQSINKFNMHTCTTIIQVVLLLSIAHSQPYSLSQTISKDSKYTFWVDITDDGSIMVAADDQKTYIHLKDSGHNFSPSQTLTEATDKVMLTDITADGSKLLEIDQNGNARVYENNNNVFTLAQTLTPSTATTDARGGAITDDGQWIAFGSWSGKFVDIFKWTGSSYTINQTISVPYEVRDIALTPDHMFMGVGCYS